MVPVQGTATAYIYRKKLSVPATREQLEGKSIRVNKEVERDPQAH
jgi:hypothetical protein